MDTVLINTFSICFLGHFDVVRLLIEGGANVNAVNAYKYTALLMASWGKLEI